MIHTTSPITIIGAGIGGLTTALALKQQGIQAAIYESSPEIKPVGAGIIMAHNAMQVFEKLGIHHAIEKAGHSISHIKITNAQGAVLSSLDLSEYEQKYGVHNIAIHRGELQKILAEEIGYDHIHLNKRLSQIEKKEAYNLAFEDGSTLKSSFVIGADGIKSVVRKQLFPKSTIRSAKQKCWRGICEMQLPQKYHHQAIEAWGKGKRFGFSKISDTKVYWFAVVNSQKNQPEEADLASLFGEFHSDMLDLILATPKEQIIVNDIIDLKPISKWQNGNCCLLGDAAHATTPNLGQGACQAVEDAYVLAKLLAQGMPFEQGCKEYEKIRVKKAHAIVNTSWALGKMAHFENSAGIWLRNSLIKNIPLAVNRKQLEMIFTLP